MTSEDWQIFDHECEAIGNMLGSLIKTRSTNRHPIPDTRHAMIHHLFSTIQARLIVLLLRHDAANFRRYIATHPDDDIDGDVPEMRRYRELGVLFYLRDELFEHILPRIVRRLSFVSPRAIIREEPPARGRIDWQHTLRAGWDECPDQPPLILHTRQHRRDFATPENLLTVVTLIQYRDD
ncbi:MAG: hypothetical protein HC837_12545, partial [Chloroflexaceae bacterium]|nr:hypothetical protein [Chloroflexaceae bacterium]